MKVLIKTVLSTAIDECLIKQDTQYRNKLLLLYDISAHGNVAEMAQTYDRVQWVELCREFLY